MTGFGDDVFSQLQNKKKKKKCVFSTYDQDANFHLRSTTSTFLHYVFDSIVIRVSRTGTSAKGVTFICTFILGC